MSQKVANERAVCSNTKRKDIYILPTAVMIPLVYWMESGKRYEIY